MPDFPKLFTKLSPVGCVSLLGIGSLVLIAGFCLLSCIMFPPWMSVDKANKRWTYPWNFGIRNSSGQQVEFFECTGPQIRATYPAFLQGMSQDGLGWQMMSRVERIPREITVHWRMPGDSTDRTQDIAFPQVARGSDGNYLLTLQPDQTWTIVFEPDVLSEKPR